MGVWWVIRLRRGGRWGIEGCLFLSRYGLVRWGVDGRYTGLLQDEYSTVNTGFAVRARCTMDCLLSPVLLT